MTTAHIPVSGILLLHKQWLENSGEGRRADLTGITMNEAMFAGPICARRFSKGPRCWMRIRRAPF
jgi:hypothetical protein